MIPSQPRGVPTVKITVKVIAFPLLYSSSTQRSFYPVLVSPADDTLSKCTGYALLIFVSKHAINIYKIPFAWVAPLSKITQTSEIFCNSTVIPSKSDGNSPQDQGQKMLTLGAAESWPMTTATKGSETATSLLICLDFLPQSFLTSHLLWVFRFLARQHDPVCRTLNRKELGKTDFLSWYDHQRIMS